MKYLFLLDENISYTTVAQLLDLGYDAKVVSGDLAGIKDPGVVELAIAENRIIVTFDSDFGTLVFKKGLLPPGVVFLRLASFRPKTISTLLHNIVEEGEINLRGYFTVVTEKGIRQRPFK